MAKMDERVQVISASILNQAEEESKKIISKANRIREREISAFESEIIQNKFVSVQQQSVRIRQGTVRGISDVQVKAVQQLLRRRDELATTVFAAVKSRLFEYAASKEYQQAFFDQLQKCKGDWNHKESVVSVREADLVLAPRIEKVLPGCRIEADSSIKIGGWRLLNRPAGILIDSTLDAKLEEQRPWFLTHCGLKVTE